MGYSYRQISHRTARFDDPYPETPNPYNWDDLDEAWEKSRPDVKKINSLNELQPWRPGDQGKGMVLRDGTVLTWNDPNVHHNEVAAYLPNHQRPEHMIEWIHPDGSAFEEGFERFWPAMEAAGIKPTNSWDFREPGME